MPDSGFLWWSEKVNGGDVVALRASGEEQSAEESIVQEWKIVTGELLRNE